LHDVIEKQMLGIFVVIDYFVHVFVSKILCHCTELSWEAREITSKLPEKTATRGDAVVGVSRQEKRSMAYIMWLFEMNFFSKFSSFIRQKT
jgi:hypothetical protein